MKFKNSVAGRGERAREKGSARVENREGEGGGRRASPKVIERLPPLPVGVPPRSPY